MLDERTGAACLKERFTKAGYAIEENFPYDVDGATIYLDGYDPEQKVGYEFLTTEAGDRQELTPEIIALLEARAEDGKAWILLVDEVDAPEVTDLAFAADRFLEQVASRK